MKSVLHDIGKKPQHFDFLHAALVRAWETKATGYILIDGEQIVLRKGKRPGQKKGTWVPTVPSGQHPDDKLRYKK